MAIFFIVLGVVIAVAGLVWGGFEFGRWLERRRLTKLLDAKERENEARDITIEEQKRVIASLNKMLEAALEKARVLQNENAALEDQLRYKASVSEADKKKIAEQAMKLNTLQTVCNTLEANLSDQEFSSQELKSKNNELLDKLKNLQVSNSALKQAHSVDVDDYKASVESDANWQAFNNFG